METRTARRLGRDLGVIGPGCRRRGRRREHALAVLPAVRGPYDELVRPHAHDRW
ncbi:hypothetical protein [Pseudonocardia nigra]|uniref:hypothetical protein n=1 Tax=Pseudonocardia nigra TaxID=1921578 RepID=UPI001C5E3FAE|nr:hypothetical protein [Pseudonocardia nigra]